MKRLWIGLGTIALLLSAAPGGRAQVLLGGDIGFINYGSRLRVFVEHITNFGDQTTERLRIRIWGTKDRGDQFFEGRVLSAASVPRVFPHQDFDDLRRTFRLFDPPTGWYYVSLTLEERTLDEQGKVHWEVRDAVYLDGLYFFRDPDDWWWAPFPF